MTNTPIDEMSFCCWVGQAAPGDVVEYHRGFLVRDTDPQISSFPKPIREGLAATARRAWWAADMGLVHLIQRRNQAEDYSYLAIARPRTGRTTTTITDLLMAEVA